MPISVKRKSHVGCRSGGILYAGSCPDPNSGRNRIPYASLPKPHAHRSHPLAPWVPAIASRAIYELDRKDQICKISIANSEVKLHGLGFRPYP